MSLCLHQGGVSAQERSKPRVLISGGGSSHRFDEEYGHLDAATLANAGDLTRYTTSLKDLPKDLPRTDVLIQASNQTPGPDPDVQRAVIRFVSSGGGFIALHAGTWYNWPEWPEYNHNLIGGGTRAHDRYGEFEVAVTAPGHPVMQGVPAHFKLSDELYHQEMDAKGLPVQVLAAATSPLTGKTYPIIWAMTPASGGRIVCITLGHDEAAHNAAAYKRILVNAVSWVSAK